jgi:hypothetical protein
MSSIPSINSSAYVAQSVAGQTQASAPPLPGRGSDDESRKVTENGPPAGRRLDVTA